MVGFPIPPLAGGMQMDALSTSPGSEDGRSRPVQTAPLTGQTDKLCNPSVLSSITWGLWRPHRAVERIK